MKIGFIGLGQMGSGMVSRLLDAGHPLVVWNRTRAAAEVFAARGASIADDPADTLTCDIVISMLADDAATEAVWITAGLAQQMPPATLHLN